MSPVRAIASCYKHSFDFRGRASRSECWWFMGWVFAGLLPGIFAGAFVGVMLESTLVGLVFMYGWFLAHLVPYLAVQARRLHDWDRTGWWLVLHLAGIGSLVLLAMMLPGTRPHPNRWGPPASPHPDRGTLDEPQQ